jgi:phospholipid/cholesterol/gamma-HCH transport system ATP-binding protein
MTDAELLETRLGFGAMLQGSRQFDCGLFNSSTLYRNVAFALQQNGVHPDHQEEIAIRWLAKVGLEKQRHMLPHEVSAGMRKRAALARALAPETSIVLLDEFEGGLDPVRLSLMCELLLEVQAQRGCTVLMTTHSTEVAARLADTLAVLRAGRIAACGAPAELLAHESMVQAFLRGDRGAAEGDTAPFEDELTAAEQAPRRPATIVLLSAVLIVLTTLILYLLIPVLRGDVNLNPYN